MELVTYEELYGKVTEARDFINGVARSYPRIHDRPGIKKLGDLFGVIVIDLDHGYVDLEKVDNLMPTFARAIHMVKGTRMGSHGDEEVWMSRNEEESNQINYINWVVEQLKGLKEQTPELPD